MGNTINLICDETPELKLGPGEGRAPVPGQMLVFFNGFVSFDEDDYPEWERWVNAPGTPHIDIVESEEERVARTAELGFNCPDCQKSFANKRALGGHRLSHQRQ